MLLIDKLSAFSYSFVKKNRIIKDIVMPVWKFTTKLRSNTSAMITGAKPCLPPSGFIDNTHVNSDTVIKTLSEKMEAHRKLPGTIEEKVHWKFLDKRDVTYPPTFTMELEGGRVYGEGGIITKENKLLSSLSKTIKAGEYNTDTSSHPVFSKKELPPLKKVKGTVAVLSAPAGRGYYHWMFDVLPRIQLLKEAGYNLDKIDKFLINNYISRFHIETIKMLDIPRNKIMESGSNPHFQADKLIVPSLVGDTGSIPKYACEFLRKEFLPHAPVKADNPKRIYLNRTSAVHRRVTNEKEMVSYLKTAGFKSIAFENLSLQEQISLMASAEVVIAPHGAGLTNIVFCKPGTKIIELLSALAVNVMYWTLSNQVDLDYYYLFAEGIQPPDHVNSYQNNDDMEFSVQKLKETLALAGIN